MGHQTKVKELLAQENREMRKFIWYVDLPNPVSTGDDDSWVNIGVYRSEEEAYKVLEERWGIKAEYAPLFITLGEEV